MLSQVPSITKSFIQLQHFDLVAASQGQLIHPSGVEIIYPQAGQSRTPTAVLSGYKASGVHGGRGPREREGGEEIPPQRKTCDAGTYGRPSQNRQGECYGAVRRGPFCPDDEFPTYGSDHKSSFPKLLKRRHRPWEACYRQKRTWSTGTVTGGRSPRDASRRRDPGRSIRCREPRCDQAAGMVVETDRERPGRKRESLFFFFCLARDEVNQKSGRTAGGADQIFRGRKRGIKEVSQYLNLSSYIDSAMYMI